MTPEDKKRVGELQKENSELKKLVEQKELVEIRLRKSWQDAINERDGYKKLYEDKLNEKAEIQKTLCAGCGVS